MITIFTMAYNEAVRLKFMIDHYKARFPSAQIIVYDNYSTDATAQIAKDNGCEVKAYESNNKVDDNLLTVFKNNCWKNAETNWVMVIDIDEILDINEEQLQKEEVLGTTIIKPEGWNMVNMEDNYDFSNMKYGYRHPDYDKTCLFNKKYISEINFMHGAHRSGPTGVVKFSDNVYKLYHYHYINLDFILDRYKMTAARMSEANRRNRWGWHYWEPEAEIIKTFNEVRA